MTTPDQHADRTRDDVRPDGTRHDDIDGDPRTTAETDGPVYGSDPATPGTSSALGTSSASGPGSAADPDDGQRAATGNGAPADTAAETYRPAAAETYPPTRTESDTGVVDADPRSDADSNAGIGTGAQVGTPTTPSTPSAVTPPADTERARLVPAERAESYSTRWDAVKGTFVDEPRQAVAQADELVGELLEELERLFRDQRSSLEHGLDADETSTEDLRQALRRYRSFFDRLLSL